MSANELLIAAYFLIAGLMVGSFLNVVIYRFPINLNREWKKNAEEFLEQLDEENNEKIVETSNSKAESSEEKPSTFNIAYPLHIALSANLR